MVISFDLDDVLAEFQQGWAAFNNRNYKTSLTFEDFTVFDYEKVMGISHDEVFKRIFEYYESDIIENLSVIPDSQKIVSELAKEHDLYVLSSRPEEISDITDRWVHKHFGNSFKKILLIGQISRNGYNYKVTKGDMCREYGVSYHIEDAPHHIDGIVNVGTKVVVHERPWNKSHDFGNTPIIRIKSLAELPEIIRK